MLLSASIRFVAGMGDDMDERGTFGETIWGAGYVAVAPFGSMYCEPEANLASNEEVGAEIDD